MKLQIIFTFFITKLSSTINNELNQNSCIKDESTQITNVSDQSDHLYSSDFEMDDTSNHDNTRPEENTHINTQKLHNYISKNTNYFDKNEAEFSQHTKNIQSKFLQPSTSHGEATMANPYLSNDEDENKTLCTQGIFEKNRNQHYHMLSNNNTQNNVLTDDEINLIKKHNKNTNEYVYLNPLSAIRIEEANVADQITTDEIKQNTQKNNQFKHSYKGLLTNYKLKHENYENKFEFALDGFINKYIYTELDIEIDYDDDIIQGTNQLISQNNFNYTKFIEIAQKHNNFCLTINHESVKNTVKTILTDKNTSVLHLFPQNYFLKEYLNLDTNYYLKNDYILSFHYLYILHIFEIIMHFDFLSFKNQLKEDITHFNNTANLSPERLIENLILSRQEIKIRMNFLFYTKTELQRLYAFLIFPFVDTQVFSEYVLLYSSEKYHLYIQYLQNQEQNIYIQEYNEKNFYLSFIPLFFVTSMIEHLIMKRKFMNLSSSANIFGYENYAIFCDISKFKSKILAKKSFQKLLIIFYTFFEFHSKENVTNNAMIIKWIETHKIMEGNNVFSDYMNKKTERSCNNIYFKQISDLINDAILILKICFM